MKEIRMRKFKISMGLLILAGVAAGGCTTPATPGPGPTTGPTAMASPTTAPAAVGPAAPTVPPPAATALTHVLTQDEPYFASEPAAPGAPSSGTLKAGVKVLLVIPGAQYSQVISDTGISAFTLTDGLKPLGK
jgi:hypothetical protein